MTWAIAILVFAVVQGLLAGSFLNVCILRLPRGGSIVTPRSQCMHCRHTVRWFDNVPLLSFALLRGRCRDCGVRISWQYPLVEFAMGLWFALCVLTPIRLLLTAAIDVDVLLGSFVQAAGMCVFGFLLVGLGVIDWQTGLLPNELTIGGLCAGLFFAATESFFVPSVRVKTFFTPEEVFIGRRVGAAVTAWLVLWAIGALYQLLRRRPGLGRGDVKMMAMVGAFLGFAGTALTFFLGVGFAATAGIVLLARRRGNAATRLPFGSYLAAGGLIAALGGPEIVAWYAGLFR